MAKTDNAKTVPETQPRAPIVVGVLGFEGCSAWVTAGLLELFAVANVALRMHASGAPRFECGVIGPRRGAVRGSHGVTFATSPMRRRYDVVIAPPIWCRSVDELAQRAIELRSQTPLLQRLARRSSIMASACSGAVLLANAGLLSGRRATTCWWLAEWFRQRFADVELAPDRLVVSDDDRWTAAAGAAYLHLGVELVKVFAGERTAGATARLLLLERRRGSQSPFLAADGAARAVGDRDVERAIGYMQKNLQAPLSVAQMCRALDVSERTLARKFKSALGLSPLAWLQTQRVGRARQLLEQGSAPLERIVEQCGYEDVASFRKLFARHVGMTPREYRSRFGAEADASR